MHRIFYTDPMEYPYHESEYGRSVLAQALLVDAFRQPLTFEDFYIGEAVYQAARSLAETLESKLEGSLFYPKGAR